MSEIIIPQNIARLKMLGGVIINSIDERGFYICGDNVFYLHNDGKVHHGIKDQKKAFWKSELAAKRFYNKWLKRQ